MKEWVRSLAMDLGMSGDIRETPNAYTIAQNYAGKKILEFF